MELSTYAELKQALGCTGEELVLFRRNAFLAEIANGFHSELQRLRYDMGGSLMDEVEDVLVEVLNGYAYEDKVAWLGIGEGYGLRS